MSSSWIIVGGGIHGVHIAARLIGEGGVAPEQVRILDPGRALLARWRAYTRTTGMTHLRSPSVHHLDLDPMSLRQFAGKRGRRKPGLFASPYNRPSLDLFNAHCDRVIEEHGLGAVHVRARVSACRVDCDGVSVTTDAGRALRATQVVLAMGTGEQPEWPSWAPSDDPRVAHIFEPGFSFPHAADSVQDVAVIGGGISAAQVALRLADQGRQVHLIARHAPRKYQFDSDPGWLGPKLMTRFERERNVNRRRAMIAEARHRGSVPPDIGRALRRAVDSGWISWRTAEVRCVIANRDALRLELSTRDDVSVQRVFLATGFSPKRPGGAMLDGLIKSASLPCAECGYPIVDRGLHWHPRVQVTGPLAELELGPVSRNIAGARRAGDRIISGLRGDPRRLVRPPAVGLAVSSGTP